MLRSSSLSKKEVAKSSTVAMAMLKRCAALSSSAWAGSPSLDAPSDAVVIYPITKPRALTVRPSDVLEAAATGDPFGSAIGAAAAMPSSPPASDVEFIARRREIMHLLEGTPSLEDQLLQHMLTRSLAAPPFTEGHHEIEELLSLVTKQADELQTVWVEFAYCRDEKEVELDLANLRAAIKKKDESLAACAAGLIMAIFAAIVALF